MYVARKLFPPNIKIFEFLNCFKFTFFNINLFRYINEYTDLRSLCDTCTLLSTLKKYIVYLFNKNYSLMYHDDISFQNRVLNKIFNPIKQLHLNLSCCYNEITDVSELGNVHTLDLTGCYNITNIRIKQNKKKTLLSFFVVFRNFLHFVYFF